MKIKKYVRGRWAGLAKAAVFTLLAIILLSANSAVFAANAGLYFQDPVVAPRDGGYRFLEEGARAYFNVSYLNDQSYQQMTNCRIAFDFDPAVIVDSSIAVGDLTGGKLKIQPMQKVGNRVTVDMLLDPSLGAMGLVADNPIIQVSFRVIKPSSSGALNGRELGITWVKTDANPANNANVYITGQGPKYVVTDSLVGVKIESGTPPTFGGINPTTINNKESDGIEKGNTLHLTWTDGSDKVVSAATHYHANTNLRYNVYRAAAAVPSGTATPGNFNFTAPVVSDVLAPKWDNTGLDDNKPYAYVVRGQDDCYNVAGSRAPNEEQNLVYGYGMPHDYFPPGASIAVTGTKDQEIDLQWGCSDGADLGGYIVIRKEGAIGGTVNDPPNITGATLSVNGTDPTTAKATLVSDGWTVVSEGMASSKPDTGLDNSKQYTYWVYSYDKVGGSPVNQGYNWFLISGRYPTYRTG
jgi:hypothetical protein